MCSYVIHSLLTQLPLPQYISHASTRAQSSTPPKTNANAGSASNNSEAGPSSQLRQAPIALSSSIRSPNAQFGISD